MNTLEVTDEQYAFVQQLREEISEKVVGKYGTVRERDAVQFLIDNVDAELDVDADGLDGDVEALTYEESDDDEVEAAVSSASDPELDALEESEPGESSDEDDGSGEDAGVADDEAADADDGNEPETSDDDAGIDEDGDESDENGAADDDDMLDQMMNLLDTHDDKWEESPSADYRYRVTLPDGSTEDVQTKDDVRALLFKNY